MRLSGTRSQGYGGKSSLSYQDIAVDLADWFYFAQTSFLLLLLLLLRASAVMRLAGGENSYMYIVLTIVPLLSSGLRQKSFIEAESKQTYVICL